MRRVSRRWCSTTSCRLRWDMPLALMAAIGTFLIASLHFSIDIAGDSVKSFEMLDAAINSAISFNNSKTAAFMRASVKDSLTIVQRSEDEEEFSPAQVIASSKKVENSNKALFVGDDDKARNKDSVSRENERPKLPGNPTEFNLNQTIKLMKTNLNETLLKVGDPPSLIVPRKSYMYQCSSGCVRFPDIKSQGTCFGKLKSFRKQSQMKQWRTIALEVPKKRITIPGSIIAFRATYQSSRNNINHQFHDDFLAIVSSFYEEGVDKNFTLIYEAPSLWMRELVLLAAKTFGWNNIQTSPVEYSTICASDNIVLVNGLGRDKGDRMRDITEPLRKAAWDHLGLTKQTVREKPNVVIYSRMESKYRQLHETEAVVDLFDKTVVNITVVSIMPTSFWDQVRLFASTDLMIAPNGGWSPNVMWMPHDACLVELHLYKVDSWIRMFGLHRRFQSGNFMTITGDYSDPKIVRVERPTRRGGDDTIFGSRLISDLTKLSLKNTSGLGRFLKVVPS